MTKQERQEQIKQEAAKYVEEIKTKIEKEYQTKLMAANKAIREYEKELKK